MATALNGCTSPTATGLNMGIVSAASKDTQALYLLQVTFLLSTPARASVVQHVPWHSSFLYLILEAPSVFRELFLLLPWVKVISSLVLLPPNASRAGFPLCTHKGNGAVQVRLKKTEGKV